ncbi:MAG: XdhC/CoxI family protein, partial [Gemmatimonadetes bacterium]|nr:XdhC/CoxI family protein [Gemmatimonadota bacterium]
ATVTRTWGSAPRRAGSHMAVRVDGAFEGSVSGGCVEGAVAQAGVEVLSTGEAQMLEFGVTNERAWEVGLACGGSISVRVEPVTPEVANLLARLMEAQEEGRPVVLATRLEDGAQALLGAEASDPEWGGAEIGRCLRADRALTIENGVFLRPYNPPPEAVVVGAVHIAQALVPMTERAGFGVTVIDPRTAFATQDRFPGARLLAVWPEEALADLEFHSRTAVVALTHDPKIDDPVLKAAVASPAFYVGALGGRKTHQQRRERLVSEGLGAAEVDRIRGPIGLPIGARTPEEIAVAILAEMVDALRNPDADPLSR